MRRLITLAPLVLVAAGVSCAGNKQSEPKLFPFVIPWDDATPGTATDVSFLSPGAAGSNGRIVVKGGVFVEEKTGKRVRFFATNMVADAAFPSKQDAPKIAARAAKLGINLVRFHHLQNGWSTAGMIWRPDKKFIEFSPEQVDRLDYFIACLKKNGIYTNMNLTTTRDYQPEQGFPKSVLDIKTGFCKKVDKFNARMIDLQKEYAKQLLDRTNTYTGLKYKDDPALAFVEINNENSLVMAPWESMGAGLFDLPEPFRGDLVKLWNKWLAAKYKTDEAMQKAWTAGITPRGSSLLNGGSKWAVENHSNGDMDTTFTEVSAGQTTAPGLKLTIRSNTGPDWHIQAHQPGLKLKDGDTYSVRFRARSDKAQAISIGATLDVSDWHNVGLSSSVNLTTGWKDYAFSFVANNVGKATSRVGFIVGSARGTIEIQGYTVFPGLAGSPVDANQSLAKGNIDLPVTATKQMSSDFVEFLADTEKAFSEGMRSYLRKDLGISANIIDTQISWGGTSGLFREQSMEYADNHSYWQHPVFPGQPWDSNNWYVNRLALVNEMDKGYGTLGDMSLYRVAGKPYTISEYNHPAPNDFQSEMMPLISTYAAAQGWDGFYTFDYGPTPGTKPNDAIDGYFSVATNPAKAAFFPSTALIYRLGLVAENRAQAWLQLPAKSWLTNLDVRSYWNQVGGLPNPYEYKIGIQQGTGTTANLLKTMLPATKPQISVKRGPNGAIYTTDAPSAKVFTGFVNNQTVSLSETTFSFGELVDGFASATLVACDGQPILTSKRILLTLVGRVENQEMGWDKARTTVGTKWGHGPTLVEGVSCSVTVTISTGMKVYALDGKGSRTHEVKAFFADGKLKFTAGPEHKTVWYEICK